MLTLGSLFDGIGGWLLAAKHNNVRPVWSSEIDEYPAAVTAHHFPNVKQYGDITKIDGAELEPVDIICAGSPCQDLSIAGCRKGLDGTRSNLFYEAIRVFREMRDKTNGEYPRYFVWENVPGAFSSNKGADFRAVLSEIGETEVPMPVNGKWANAGLAELPKCQIAWRVLDAQYFGVAQRRRRIFLVADFAGKSAGEILFECQGLCGDSEKIQGTRESIAESTGTSTYSAVLRMRSGKPGGGKGALVSTEKSLTLATNNDQTVFSQVKIFDMTHANNPVQSYNGEKCHTLTSRMGTGGNQVPVVFSMEHDERSAALKPNQSVRKLTPVECERLQGLPDGYTDIEFNGKPAPDSQAIGHIVESEKSSTLTACDYKSPRNFVEYQKEVPLYDISHLSDGVREIPKGAVNTLAARMGTGGGNVAVLNEADRQETDDVRTVRRLTVTECERLQGLPDGWTNIEFHGKHAPDSRRYKAIGNGMAQPCADFVLKQIVKFQRIR